MAGRSATRPPIPRTHVAALPRSLRARFRARKPHHPPSCRSPARRARSQQPSAHPRTMAHHSALTKSHRVGLSHIWVRPESWPAEFFPVRVRDLVGSEYFDRLVLVGPAVHHPDSPPPFQKPHGRTVTSGRDGAQG